MGKLETDELIEEIKMSRTTISSTEETWNPLRGCSAVSPGCLNCYAGALASRFCGPGQPFEGFAERNGKPGGGRWTGKVELLPHKLAEPLSWRKPRLVFVNSMSDLFHEAVPFQHIAAVFGVMAATPHITYQVLTKRAERMPEWFRWAECPGKLTRSMLCLREAARRVSGGLSQQLPAWPLPNVWLGVSAEDQKRWDERVPKLLECPAAVRWVSIEPQLEEIDPGSILKKQGAGLAIVDPLAGLDWIVQGGESGPAARPFHLEWARSMRDACREAGVAWFGKQVGSNAWLNGERYRTADKKGEDPAEWPEDLRVREWPRLTLAR